MPCQSTSSPRCRIPPGRQVYSAAGRAPLEVFEVITSYLDDSDLPSTSLVCRLWSAAARRRRFRAVTVSAHYFGLPPSSSLLCDPRSTILPFVHMIRFKEGTDFDAAGRLDEPYESGTPFLDAILPVIRIYDLTDLRSLEFVDLTWDKLSIEARRALSHLCRPITSLSLFNIWGQGIPSSGLTELFHAMTGVSSLRVQELYGFSPEPDHYTHQDWMWDEDDGHPVQPLAMKVVLPLKSLTIDCWRSLLPFCHRSTLLTSFTLPHITDLTLGDIHRSNIGGIMYLLRGCASTVEHLQLRFSDLLIGRWVISIRDRGHIPECAFLPLLPWLLSSC